MSSPARVPGQSAPLPIGWGNCVDPGQAAAATAGRSRPHVSRGAVRGHERVARRLGRVRAVMARLDMIIRLERMPRAVKNCWPPNQAFADTYARRTDFLVPASMREIAARARRYDWAGRRITT